MQLTPAIKGQLTKAIKNREHNSTADNSAIQNVYTAVRAVFSKYMPAEQAKHATRKYLAQVA